MALEECGIFFLCRYCSIVRRHRHEMRLVNGPQRTKPREDKLPEDASAEYVPEEGANMALADGISTPLRQRDSRLQIWIINLKTVSENSLLLKERRGKSAQRRNVKPPD